MAGTPRPGSGAIGSRRLAPASVLVAIAAVFVVAAIALALAGAKTDSDALGHPVAFVVLTLLLSCAHVSRPRVEQRNGGLESSHLDVGVFVPMVLMLSPMETAITVAAASLAGSLSSHRPAPRALRAMGLAVFAVLCGYAVAHLGGAGPHAPGDFRTLVAAMAGGLVFAAVSTVTVVAASPTRPHDRLRIALRQLSPGRLLTTNGALLFGVVAGVAVEEHAWAAIPAVVLGLTLEQAYSAVTIQREARRAAENLREAVVAVRESDDPDEVRRQVLAAVRTVLRAPEVTLVDQHTPCPPGALRARLDDTTLQIAARGDGSTWLDSDRAALSTLTMVGGGVLRNARLLAQMSAITDSQSEGVLAIDATGVVTFANPAARQLAQCEDLVGRVAEEVLELRGSDPVDLAALAVSHGRRSDNDAVLVTRTRSTPVSFTATAVTEPQTGVVLVIHDITERKAFEEKLTYLAFHDPLTYLPNRRLFEDRLDHALLRGQRHHTRHALLMIDLDRFKLINDSYGHPAGDSVLVHIAGLLRNSLRREDTCARLGGDEFAVLLEDVEDVSMAVAVAERFLEALGDGCVVEGHDLFVGASIGIALSDQAETREDLIAAADTAAYQAKAAGKGRYQVFASDTAGDPRARLEMEADLRHALDHGEFELHYQPIVEITSGEYVGAEALLRWNTAGGVIAPHAFVPLAEETGLIVPLGIWVLEEACRQAQSWRLARPTLPPLQISVNLSALQIVRPTFVSEVAAVLEQTGLPPEQLCLEITETVIMRDTDTAIATLRQLKELGVHMAIDDFGTGYSSLSYLKRFPVDVVKIDQLFVAGLGEDAVDSEIVTAVIRLATACGITAIAEGVETAAQRSRLEELGCPQAQGFLISRPMPADDFVLAWVSGTLEVARSV